MEDKPLQVHCSLISSTNRPKHDSSSFYGAPLESELQHTERYLGRLKPIDCYLDLYRRKQIHSTLLYKIIQENKEYVDSMHWIMKMLTLILYVKVQI